MAKFRARSKTGKNRQRWKKGQSSSSNPHKTTHRDAAKARMLRVGFGAPEPAPFDHGPSRLTAESLLKHDALMGNVDKNDAIDNDDDALTLGQTNKTFDTFASSVWSDCSNVSFARMLPRFNPGNPKHKEMLAILSAIAEVIKEQNSDQEPSGVEYLGALLTSLDTTESVECLSATIALLSIVIKTIDKAVLQAKFSITAKLLLELLSRHGESEDASIVRGLLGCLSVLLRHQENSAWSESSTVRVMDSILSFVTDKRPKVRKAAQHAVISILCRDPDSFHPNGGHVAHFLIDLVESNLVGSDVKPVLHILILFKEILPVLPKKDVKSVCEEILKVMSLGNAFTLSCGLQALFGLFAARPSAKSLPSDMNAKLIAALYDFQPSINDGQPMIAWLTVQQEAHINLAAHDAVLCLENLPKLFTNVTRCWASDRGEVSVAATTALKAVLNEGVKPNVDKFENDTSNIKAFFGSIENGLKYQFHGSWAQVLNLLTTFFDVCGQKYSQVGGRCLQALAELRSSANFTLTNELDYVIGKAVRTMGPEVVLTHIPLNITGREDNYDFPRSWLLPVLRENVQNANLSYFKSNFLPIALACQNRSEKAEAEGDKIGFKTYEMIASQIWALLPGFCNNPKDLKDSFDDIAKTMGGNLQRRKDLRMYILASLRQLAMKSVDEESRQVLGKWAEKFLHTMCNLYIARPNGAEEAGQRLSVMETVKLFLQFVEPSRQGVMFDAVLSKFANMEDEFTKDACHDLLRVMLKFQSQDRIHNMYKLSSEVLANKDHKKQKKGYKMLEEICSSDSQSCLSFLRDNLPEIQKSLLASLSKASPPSQASRLKCLINIIRNLENANAESEDFLFKIVPEAVLCIKAANEKARSGSYTLLVVIGETLMKWRDDNELAIKDYMKVILAGLAGGPTLIHCSLKAITRVYFEFHDIFPDDLTEMLIGNVCLLLTSQSREVVNPSVSFLHVFVTTSPVMGSARFCEKIVSALCKMTEDCKRHFRLKTRYLFDRLVRKFGYDVVKALIPKDDETTLKRLKNIKKLQARKKKADEEKDENEESDDEEFRIKARPKTIDEILEDANDEGSGDEGSENNGKKTIRRKKKSATFIAEEASGEAIVDFLDSTAAQNVRRSRPNMTTSANASIPAMKRKEEFEIAPDGRIIIRDDSDDENVKRKGNRMLEDSDDDENEFASLVSTNARKRKRGGSIASSKISEPASKYKAGGTGIHRPLDKDYGAEYRSTKAKGDVKRKGKPDPYAYVPLHKGALNKRKRAKFEGQFKGLVKAAAKGSSKGSKSLRARMKNVKL